MAEVTYLTSEQKGDKLIDLEQVFRGDHTVVPHSTEEPPGTGQPKWFEVFRKTFDDAQARLCVVTLAPVEVSEGFDPGIIGPVPETGPIIGRVSWGIEGGSSNQVEFDWGSAIFNGASSPDGRNGGFQFSLPASFVRIEAQNLMGFPIFGFGPANVGALRNAILNAFMTVGATALRLTPVTRSFFHVDPLGLGGYLEVVPMFAKRVRILRAPTVGMIVNIYGFAPILDPTALIETYTFAAGVNMENFVTLTPDAKFVEVIFPGVDALTSRAMFEIAL